MKCRCRQVGNPFSAGDGVGRREARSVALRPRSSLMSCGNSTGLRVRLAGWWCVDGTTGQVAKSISVAGRCIDAAATDGSTVHARKSVAHGRHVPEASKRHGELALSLHLLAYLLINPAAGSTLFLADPFVITRIQMAWVDGNGPVVVMSRVPRYEIFRMTRSITHVIKFSMKQTPGRLGTQLIRSGVVELLG